MRRLPMGSLFLPLFAAASVACAADTDDAAHDWHVAGGHLRDPDGRAVILRGANVSGRHKSPPYFDFHEQGDFERMRAEWGMNSVRFLILWAAIEPEEGVYDDGYLDALATRMEWLESAGLLVILDMHQDLYGEGFGGDGAPAWTCDEAHYAAYEPTEPWFANYANEHVVACYDGFWSSDELLSHYVEAWRRVAERLADSPAVIGIDPMNEPFWGSEAPSTFEEADLGALYERVVAAARESAPHWVAFLEPSASRNLGISTSLLPFSFPNVVYAPHSYDSLAEGGDGFDPERRQALVDNYPLLRQEADWLDAALWIGEYGGIASDPGIVEYMDAQYDGAGAVAAGTCYWTYTKSDGYGMLDAEGNEKPGLMGALVRPYPERVAGSPVDYRFDEATRVLTFAFEPDADVSAPTEIVVPERVYPGGVEVDCGGCAVEAEPGRVRLLAPPPGVQDAATVTVRPK